MQMLSLMSVRVVLLLHAQELDGLLLILGPALLLLDQEIHKWNRVLDVGGKRWWHSLVVAVMIV